MAAIEFAVKFDDGVGDGLREADIILVGVSRTSKTPLSMYLGYLGYKTANVPIVKGIEPPGGAVLQRSRQGRRADDRRGPARRHPPGAGATDARRPPARTRGIVEIYEELDEAASIHRRLGCPVIDVTELSVEETAQRVIRLVETRSNGRQAP